MAKQKNTKNINYDFKDQREPNKPMGSGSFANLPTDVITRKFDGPTYRGGLVNSFSASVSDLSGISENGSLDGNA